MQLDTTWSQNNQGNSIQSFIHYFLLEEHSFLRKCTLSPTFQVLLTLRYYATGTFQITCGDLEGVHQTTAGKIIRKVSFHIASMYGRVIKLPVTDDEIVKAKKDFYDIARFPQIIASIDGTHIKIQNPGGNYGEMFRNRKRYFSMNVQGACNAKLEFVDVVK